MGCPTCSRSGAAHPCRTAERRTGTCTSTPETWLPCETSNARLRPGARSHSGTTGSPSSAAGTPRAVSGRPGPHHPPSSIALPALTRPAFLGVCDGSRRLRLGGRSRRQPSRRARPRPFRMSSATSTGTGRSTPSTSIPARTRHPIPTTPCVWRSASGIRCASWRATSPGSSSARTGAGQPTGRSRT